MGLGVVILIAFKIGGRHHFWEQAALSIRSTVRIANASNIGGVGSKVALTLKEAAVRSNCLRSNCLARMSVTYTQLCCTWLRTPCGNIRPDRLVCPTTPVTSHHHASNLNETRPKIIFLSVRKYLMVCVCGQLPSKMWDFCKLDQEASIFR